MAQTTPHSSHGSASDGSSDGVDDTSSCCSCYSCCSLNSSNSSSSCCSSAAGVQQHSASVEIADAGTSWERLPNDPASYFVLANALRQARAVESQEFG